MNEQLLAHYSTPGRHYHTVRHIEDCLRQLDDIGDLADGDREILRQAFLWHDAVYDPQRADNEEQSAVLAMSHCDPAIRDEVARLVLLTKSHQVDEGDRLGAIMISIDLSILGAAPDVYAGYAAAIRREYQHVPINDYRTGRAAVLRKFLQRPTIFPFAPIRDRLEATARHNIDGEITGLETGAGSLD